MICELSSETSDSGAVAISDERTLILRSRTGDARAFGELVRKHMKQAYAVALGLVGSREDAMDLSQDAFVRAFRAMRNFDESRPFFPWYYRILRNLCFNFFRDRKRRAKAFSDVGDVLNHVPDKGEDPAAVVERIDLSEKLLRSLAALEPDEREIIALKDFQGYSYREISGLLGIPQGTVMSRLYHARMRLRSQCAEWMDEEH